MPAAIPLAASFFVSELVAVAIGSTIIGSIAGAIVGGVIASALSPKRRTPEEPGEVERAARGALVNTASQTDPIPVVYGTRRKGGTRVMTEATGATNEFLHIVIALSEGEVSAINTVYLDDVATTDSRFSGLVTLEKYVGTDSQAASAALISATGGKWTANDQGKGVAYLYVRLQWSENAFPSGMPVVTADVDGKLVYDPRDGNTAFSNNPALCLRDYMTNSRYGRGIPASALNEQSFKDAADYCDGVVATPTGTQKRYTCDGIADPDRGWLENLRSLLTSCRGNLVFVAGKYKLKVDRDEVAQATGFTEDNIVGSWEITNAGKRDKHNRVRARFFNPDRRWEPDITVWDDTTHRTEDNGLVLEREIDLPFTADLYRAQRIAQLEERVSRFGIACSFEANGDAMSFEVGDVVPITHTTPGWTAKPFRVVAMEPLFSGNWRVAAIEYQNIAYSLSELTSAGAVPGTNLPNPFSVSAPANVALSSGTAELFLGADGTVHSRIRVQWDVPANEFVRSGGRVEAQFLEVAGSPEEWSPSQFVDGALSSLHLSPVDDGRQYQVRLRFENSLGVRGAFTTTAAHTVVGKTAPPSDVTGFTVQQVSGGLVLFSINEVTDSDLDLVEIRWADSGGGWADGQPIANILRGRTLTNASVSPGAATFLAKARDTSANYSANAASVGFTVTATGFTEIKAQEYSPGWVGHISGLVRHRTGKLFPESTKLAKDHTRDELFGQFVAYPVATGFFEPRAEIDKTINGNARIWVDLQSHLHPNAQIGNASPEALIDHRTATGSYDGWETWTVGTANFRHVNSRVYVTTSVGKPIVDSFKVTLDAEARDETGTVTVGAGGSAAVTFANEFHTKPVTQVTPEGSGNVTAHYDSLTTTGFTAYHRTAGTLGAGTVAYTATGV